MPIGGQSSTPFDTHLADEASGLYIWSTRFEGGSADAPAILREIVGRVAAVVELQVQLAEIARSKRERPQSTAAYDFYLRGQFYLRTSQQDDNVIAYRLFQEALRIEPDNVLYLAGASEAIQHRISIGWPSIEADDRKVCADLALRGLRRAGSEDASAIALFGMSLFNSGEPDLGFATTRRAIKLNPNSVMACLTAGLASLHWGSLEDAEALLRRAHRLNPHDPLQRFGLSGLARVRMVQGRFDEAHRMGRQALGVNGLMGITHWTLIASSANLGLLDDASRRLKYFQATHPGVTVSRIRAGQPYKHNRSGPVLEGLERAGLQS